MSKKKKKLTQMQIFLEEAGISDNRFGERIFSNKRVWPKKSKSPGPAIRWPLLTWDKEAKKEDTVKIRTACLMHLGRIYWMIKEIVPQDIIDAAGEKYKSPFKKKRR